MLDFVFLKILVHILAIKMLWLIFFMFSLIYIWSLPSKHYVCKTQFYINTTFSQNNSFNKIPKMPQN